MLIQPGSEDTIENRERVKELYGSIRIKNMQLRRGGRKNTGKYFYMGPKCNVTTQDIPQLNDDIKEWLYEGDMALTVPQATSILTGKQTSDRPVRSLQTDPSGYWPTSVAINYTFSPTLSNRTVKLIRTAVQFWHDNTCLSFTENPDGINRLRFTNGSGCWSYVGRQKSWTSQDISIGTGCENFGIVTHEIGHAIGFYHTQSRYDRDDYITIEMDNIAESMQYNFRKLTNLTENHFGHKYDYGSVMQYDPYAFAMNPDLYTIVAKDVLYMNAMGQRDAPSFSDVRMINELYNCSSNCASQPKPDCLPPGYPDPRDCLRFQ
ncbi:hypothetical protein Q1695_009874 [Nippostrongylus brasiliensis]|nr:hypothetical protein Q1695_009874 [Nippostrongylus brasiliensis]